MSHPPRFYAAPNFLKMGIKMPRFVVFWTTSTIRDEKSAAKFHYSRPVGPYMQTKINRLICLDRLGYGSNVTGGCCSNFSMCQCVACGVEVKKFLFISELWPMESCR